MLNFKKRNLINVSNWLDDPIATGNVENGFNPSLTHGVYSTPHMFCVQ